ncbi:hypothetical protein CEQ90_07355 [Lewinellaceae bacterium SD302]|nr:hypothetical protein CEQ90_07355 [Lewinellaceae bacterium SD302]
MALFKQQSVVLFKIICFKIYISLIFVVRPYSCVRALLTDTGPTHNVYYSSERLQKMKTIVHDFLALAVRHWLRIGVLLVLLFIISKKQIDLNIQFGKPTGPIHQSSPPLKPAGEILPAHEEPTVYTQIEPTEDSWLQKMNILGSGDHAELSLELKQVEERIIRAFLDRFAELARTEQRKFGVPASITLANALLHSRGGTAAASLTANNYFQLGCTSDWIGPTKSLNGLCYREYENAWTSFRDHSLFVTTGQYAPLTRLGSQDYHGWSKGLEALGYNDTDDLGQQLEQVIEQWQLYRFD